MITDFFVEPKELTIVVGNAKETQHAHDTFQQHGIKCVVVMCMTGGHGIAFDMKEMSRQQFVALCTDIALLIPRKG